MKTDIEETCEKKGCEEKESDTCMGLCKKHDKEYYLESLQGNNGWEED